MVESLPQAALEARLVELPQIPEARGNLTALEELIQIPFRIGAVRWFYDLRPGSSWPGSRPDVDEALAIALSGSFEVAMPPDSGERTVRLTRASVGLHIPSAVEWKGADPAINTVALVVVSRPTPPTEPTILPATSVRDLNPATTIGDCRTIAFARHREPEWTRAAAVPLVDVPFEIRRVYYVYDIPDGASRGGHAHRALEQVLVAASGAFDIVLKDARGTRTIRLDRAHRGLYIPSGIWRDLRNFSSGATCLTLASAPYDEADYIRDYEEFRRAKAAANE